MRRQGDSELEEITGTEGLAGAPEAPGAPGAHKTPGAVMAATPFAAHWMPAKLRATCVQAL